MSETAHAAYWKYLASRASPVQLSINNECVEAVPLDDGDLDAFQCECVCKREMKKRSKWLSVLSGVSLFNEKFECLFVVADVSFLFSVLKLPFFASSMLISAAVFVVNRFIIFVLRLFLFLFHNVVIKLLRAF